MEVTNCFIHRTVGHLVNDVVYFECLDNISPENQLFLKKSGNIKENNQPNDTRINQMEWDVHLVIICQMKNMVYMFPL